MTTPANNTVFWISFLPSLACSAVMAASMWAIWRKRRWSDNKILGQATTMPLEHRRSEPRTVRDLEVGEEGYVDASRIVTSEKNHRTYVDWEAGVHGAPEDLRSSSALAIRRLARGFSLTVRPGDVFRTSPLPWGIYGPVIEIAQATPAVMPAANQNTDETGLPG
jgi:hypothetical protein